jgi:catechol 2,3-dioxygenase-like lactoylglutathione lyase family enzyme
MDRVTGVGGIFFKARDPHALSDWYKRHLGIAPAANGPVAFEWRDKEHPERVGMTIWAPFSQDTKYFAPSTAPFMINYRVHDLHALLAELRREGVAVDDRVDESEFGRFGWVMDPEGNRIELWEPPNEQQDDGGQK